MKYLIKDYYNKANELYEIEKKIKDSWSKILHIQNIPMKKYNVQINPYNTDTLADIQFHVTTLKELTPVQIREIEKNTCSQLYYDDIRTGTSNTRHHYYEFQVHTESLPNEDNILNSWLND